MLGGRHVIAEGFSEDIWLDQEEELLERQMGMEGSTSYFLIVLPI